MGAMPSSIPEGGRLDITIRQGAPFDLVLEAREDDEVTIVPLVGYSGRAQVRDRDRSDGALLLELEVGVDGPAGDVTLHAGATATAGMATGGFYDVELVNDADPDDVIPFVRGAVTLERQVTLP